MVMPQHTCIPKAAKIGSICTKSLLTDETTFNRPFPILLCFSAPNYVNYLFLTLSFMLLLLFLKKRIFSFLFSQCPPSVFFPAQKKKKKKGTESHGKPESDKHTAFLFTWQSHNSSMSLLS